MSEIPGSADTQHLRPGDRLTYDITVQVDQQTASKGSARRSGVIDSSAGAGSETVDIVAVDPDGTANGTLAIDMLGFAHGQPMALHKSVAVKVTPSGEIQPAASIDPLLDQTITLANRSVRDLVGRDLHASPNWRWQIQSDTYPMTIALLRSLRGQRNYQGLPTYIIQTIGGGSYGAATDQAHASINLAGTSYYDQRDGLFVGEALRSDSIVTDNTNGDSTDSSALVTIVLREFVRGPQIEVSPLPSPSPSETPEEVPTPTAVPTEYAPSPLPTVTPSKA